MKTNSRGQFQLRITFLFFILATIPKVILIESSSQREYSKENALKVLTLIEMIQMDQIQTPGDGSSKVVVTESEFNAYIAHRIATEEEQPMKELELKMFENNRIEGRLYFDLRGADLPRLLKPQMTFYFSGTIETENGAVRLDLDDLFLEKQRIQKALLDMVFFVVAKIGGYESSSIDDWYVLPYGIKEIKVYRGRAEFFY